MTHFFLLPPFLRRRKCAVKCIKSPFQLGRARLCVCDADVIPNNCTNYAHKYASDVCCARVTSAAYHHQTKMCGKKLIHILALHIHQMRINRENCPYVKLVPLSGARAAVYYKIMQTVVNSLAHLRTCI